MPKKEFKVGEVFQFGIHKLKVELSKGYCTHCFLNDICDRMEQCNELVGECCGEYRKDESHVIFVKVDDIEE